MTVTGGAKSVPPRKTESDDRPSCLENPRPKGGTTSLRSERSLIFTLNQHKFNLFLSLSKRLRPILCGESKVFEQAEKITKELKKAGENVSMLSIHDTMGIAACGIASYIVQQVPVLTPAHQPIVAGVTLLVCTYGHRRICKALSDALASYDPVKDRFAGSFRCGAATNDGTPCQNPVRREGTLCWIHARECSPRM